MFELLILLAVLGLAAVTSAISIPTIVHVSKLKHLYDEPDSRKATQTIVPTLGGVALFIAFVIAFTLGSYGKEFPELRYILCGLTILFFIGIKDDILIISARKKLFVQILTALILVFMADIRFTSVHGFLGIHNIPYPVSAALTVFVIIVTTNAFNLIDGIDGLASGICMLTAGAMGSWFFLSGHYQYAIMAVALIGALAGFFTYNVWGVKNKIFMGDTGSLLLGLIMSVLLIKFCEFNITETGTYFIHSVPAVAFGLLIVPLFDTIRVFSIRLRNKRSPFTPDKNHVHHRLLHLGYSHLEATSRIVLINAAFIAMNIYLMEMSILGLMIVNLVAASVVSMIPIVMMRYRKIEIEDNDPHQQVLVPSKEIKKINNKIKERKKKKKNKKNKHKELTLEDVMIQ